MIRSTRPDPRRPRPAIPLYHSGDTYRRQRVGGIGQRADFSLPPRCGWCPGARSSGGACPAVSPALHPRFEHRRTGGSRAGPAHAPARASRLATQNRGRRARHGPPRTHGRGAATRAAGKNTRRHTRNSPCPPPPSLGGNIPLPGARATTTTCPAHHSPLLSSPQLPPTASPPPVLLPCSSLSARPAGVGLAWLARRQLSEFGFSSRIWASGARRPTGQVLFDLNVLEDKKTSIIKLQKVLRIDFKIGHARHTRST